MGLKKSEISVLSKRYAKALYEASQEGGIAEDSCGQLLEISRLVNESSELKRTFEKNRISGENINKIVEVFKEKLGTNDKVGNFLKLLNENGRLFLIEEVANNLNDILRGVKNTITAKVYTAKKLSESAFKQVNESLKATFNKDVEIEEIIDKSVLGGLKIKVGSMLFDDSISSKINRLKIKFENN